MDLLILALVAGFLMYRLNAVLGQKDKDDPAEKNPLKTLFPSADSDDGTPKPAAPENVVTLPGRPAPVARPDIQHDGPMSLDNQIRMLSEADPSFDEMRFLAGAKAAFGMIVDAFARGDKKALQPLLSAGLYDDFAAEIDERTAKGHSLETIVQSIEDVAITHARIRDRVMAVTVRIVSLQTNMVRDDQGQIISGGEQSDDVTDFWVFQREIGNPNPNWALISTDAG